MPIPNNKIFLSSALMAGGAVRFTPNAVGDFIPLVAGAPVPAWLGATTDINGDGRPDLIFGSPLDDDKALDAGRIFIETAPLAAGSTVGMGDSLTQIIIDGVRAGDHAGAAVGGIADLNADGRGEILIGAPGMEVGVKTDAGVAFVVWGKASGGIDLADPYAGTGGFSIRGEVAGDAAGTSIMSMGDLNGDGLSDILVGAPGNDAGGADAGAAYVVWGKSTGTAVNLAGVATGTGGFKIVGADNNDLVGSVIGVATDMNGDGKSEVLIGVPEFGSGGASTGAVYVVFGKGTGTAVDLNDVEAGTGGFIITGMVDDKVGSAVSGIGDVNGDGLGDVLVTASAADKAYVVFGKANGTAVDLNDVAAGIGGFQILAQGLGDLDRVSVAGGRDLNHDGIADFVMGTPTADEAGTETGAVYVVWGGGSGTVDLSLIAQSIGGAKIVGTENSLTGSTVSLVDDMNGDGTADIMIGAPGTGESAWLLYSPATWQPDNNVYGTNGADVMGPGYGSGSHVIGETADNILGLAGNDTINAAGGNDTLDGGTGADAMSGGAGDDTYYVDNALDTAIEVAGEGTDTVITTVNFTLGAQVENLTLTGAARIGTGNGLANRLVGTAGADTLDGAGGADTMLGGLGNDTYHVDNAGDVVDETGGGGTDTVRAAIDYTLGAGVENLVLTASGLIGTGNALNNSLTGTTGADRLDGGLGADTMTGGLGNDAYVVDSLADVVVEGAAVGSGVDAVQVSIDGYTLAANVEILNLTGAALSGTGNALNNTLTGTAGNNVLDGGLGNDTLDGGVGDDTYFVDSLGDVVWEQPFGLNAGGTDTIVASIDYTLGEGLNVENLTLSGAAHHATGNSGNNTLTGGTGADFLDGGAGIDTLIGGSDDDTYTVDSLTDTITELTAGGNDTVVSSVDFTLANGSNIENLTLTGAATHGIGNDDNNVLTGAAGVDTLEGGLGNDRLDGGLGADTLIGGAGDDTYVIDNPGDVVIENAGEGTDTVVVGSDWTLADNIENVRLSGTGHALTGNSANNTMEGDIGDDTLDGGLGDDTLIAGDGDDRLVSSSGRDTLAGGSGDDVYEIHGGSVHIEDFQGHDTIDCSDAAGDSYIDLSGETDSEIENEICDFGTGGTITGALNVQFLQDLTGSFADDIANVRTLIPQITTALNGVSGGAAFGVSTFRDMAFGAFGSAGDWVYATALGMGSTDAALTAAYTAFVAGGGADLPESQLTALMQVGLRAGTEIGFQSNSARFVVIFTDANFHTAADGTAAGLTLDNNGDMILDAGENYPLVAQVRSALEAANIIPIFAVTAGFETSYQQLATDLGRGSVVTLTANSSNIVTAITGGLTAATTTNLDDAVAGAGNDTLIGNVGDNLLSGNGGDDTCEGRFGDDRIHGGDGFDTAVYSGLRSDYTITDNGDGTVTVADNRSDGEGIDILDGVERIKIGTEFYTATGGVPVAPVATNDRLLVTSGQASAIDAAALLGNDTISSGEALSITAVSNAVGGTVVLVNGQLVVTATGPVSFDYTVTSASGQNATGHVTVDVAALDAAANVLAVGSVYAAGDLVGMGGDDRLTGRNGIDHLVGNDGNDRLGGGSGNDTLEGGIGNDVLTGGLGIDHATGGASDDRYNVDVSADVVVELLGEGIDLVNSSATYTLSENVENLALNGAVAIDGSGNALDNRITGNGAANVLHGFAGRDTLSGGGGDDTLYGGAGPDFLTGGTGADTFVFDLFEIGANRNIIRDFAHGTDDLAFDRSVFTAFAGDAAGAINPLQFTLGTAATTADQHLIYNAANGALYYDSDGLGGSAQVLVATLSSRPLLDAGDFVLI